MHRVSILFATLLVLAALALPAASRAQDYFVVGHFNGWATDTANHLARQADGTHERTLNIATQSGENWTAYKIVEVSGASVHWYGAVWSDDGGADGNKLLVLPAVDGAADVTFFVDPRDRTGDGWIPAGPTTGDSWTAVRKLDGNLIDDVTAFWLVSGDFEVGTGISYFDGLGCSVRDRDCAALTLSDGAAGGDHARWDETPGDGIYTLGLVVPQDLTGLTAHWRAVTNTADGNVRTELGPLGWGFVRLNQVGFDSGEVATPIPADARGQLLVLEVDVTYGRLRGHLLPPPKLLLTEVSVSPTAAEFIEIYNPGDTAVALGRYHLADTVAYARIAQATPPAVDAGDFVARFPDDASIPPHTYQVVAVQTAGAFYAAFASTTYPHYALQDDGGGHAPVLQAGYAGAVGASAGLTNDREAVVLFYWDGVNDLVMDVDALSWGTPDAVNPWFAKTGLGLDSATDADSNQSFYQADAASSPVLHAPAPALGRSVARLVYSEVGFDGSSHAQASACAPSNAYCNGLSGADEASEWSSLTWRETAAPRPGAADFEVDGTPCAADAQCQSGNCRLAPAGQSYCVAAAYLCADDAGQGLGVNDATCSGSQTWTCLGLDSFDIEDCTDGLACTVDSCALGVCSFPPQAGSCAIAGTCYADTELNPANPCEVCAAASDAGAWSAAAPGTACVDTTPDDCLVAGCQDRACDQAYDFEPATTPCSDGNACTVGDQCNASGGCLSGVDQCGEDAGVTEDAGSVEDSGASPDATLAEDATTGTDAVAGADSASGVDAGVGADAVASVDATIVADAAVEDSGGSADAAVGHDGAVPPDAAVVVDATVAPDSTVAPDAGEDAAVAEDAAVVADAAAGVDATAVDAGNAPRIDPDASGCGCSGSAPRGAPVLLLLGLLALRRRRG